MELDAAYANREYIPDGDAYPDRWQADAAAFRTALERDGRCLADIPYGESPRAIYDLFLPADAPRGLMVFVHGGFWRLFDKSSWSHFAQGALDRGWAVAMPSYDLCPDVAIADITRQIARAVRAASDRVPGPLVLTGHSAGGHLVARMTDPGVIGIDVLARLKSVVPISPLSDLRPLLKTSMNEDFRLTVTTAMEESPIYMRRPEVPVTIRVGGDERPAFLDQARWLAEAWDVDCVTVPGRHHFDIIDALKDPDSDLIETLVDGY